MAVRQRQSTTVRGETIVRGDAGTWRTSDGFVLEPHGVLGLWKVRAPRRGPRVDPKALHRSLGAAVTAIQTARADAKALVSA